MSRDDVPVDFISLGMAESDSPGNSNTTFSGVLLEGECDTEALAAAVVTAQAGQPLLHSRLVDASSPLFRRFVWRTHPEPCTATIVDLRELDRDGDPSDWVIDEIYDRGRRPRDLTSEPPLHVTIARLTDELTVVGLECHHAAVDADGMWGFAKTILAHYHEHVTGQRPPWADISPTNRAASTTTAGEPASRRETFRYLREQQRLIRAHHLTSVAGTPGNDSYQLIARAVVAEGDHLDELRAHTRAAGASVTDLLVAASMCAIADWNHARGADIGLQQYSLPVSQHGRGWSRGAIALSRIMLWSLPEDLSDHEALLARVGEQRRAALDARIDVGIARFLRGVGRVASFRATSKLLKRMVRRRDSPTLVVSSPGIMWPEVVDGRITGRLAVTDVGGLRPVDWLAMVNSGPHTPALLALTFDRRLQISLAANASSMRQAELQELVDSIARAANGYFTPS